MKKLLLIMLPLLMFASCVEGQKPTTDQVQQSKTEQMVSEANRRLGIPNITKFTEKRFQKMIYELRDKEVVTYSYFMDMNGRLHFLCESIGYGLPAAVQYVSPQKLVKGVDMGSHYGDKAMPQPEPNGLFMPDSLDATYVLCTGPNGKLHPVYSEPKLIVSPFPLKAVDNLKR